MRKTKPAPGAPAGFPGPVRVAYVVLVACLSYMFSTIAWPNWLVLSSVAPGMPRAKS